MWDTRCVLHITLKKSNTCDPQIAMLIDLPHQTVIQNILSFMSNFISENLLQEFFHFCATFDFTNRAMSIRRGDWYENPDPVQFSLYLENPFETHLNASKNVKPRLVELIRDKSRLALDKMSQADFSTPREYSWGIPLLFHVEEDNHSRISSILHIISDDDNIANLTGVDDSEHRHHDVTGVDSNQNDHVISHVRHHVTGSVEITAESQGHDAFEAGGRIIGSLAETLESLPKSTEGSSSARSTQVWKRLHLSNFCVKLWVI